MSIPETKPLIKNVKSTLYTFDKNDGNDESDENDENDNNNNSKNVGGLMIGSICIIIAVLVWVFMSEYIQSSEQNHHNKPLFLRWCVNTGYLLMILPFLLSFYMKSNVNHRRHHHHHHHQKKKMNKFDIFLSSIILNLLSLSSGYIWYLSLSETVAAINNTIYQSNCVFVLIFSYFLLNQELHFTKFIASILAIIGVAFISFSSESSSESSSVIGIALCFISMILFSLFQVLFEYFVDKYVYFGSKLAETLFLQILIGFSNLLLFWPFLLLFDYFNLEKVEFPINVNQFLNKILLPCFLDLLFTSSLLCGITFCGAILTSIGLIFVIPISVISDIFIFKKTSINIINTKFILGAIFIMIGFILIQKKKKH